MIPLIIVSNRGFTGKTFVALGLALQLREQGASVGFIKPLGKTPVKVGQGIFDADAIFMREALALEDPLPAISPFVLSFETQNVLLNGDHEGVKGKIREAFRHHADKKYLLVGGSGDFFDGASFGLDAVTLSEELGGFVLLVESWRGEASLDTFVGASRLFGPRFVGGVLNRVPVPALSHIRDRVKPFLEERGLGLFGAFAKDTVLEAVTVRQLNDVLHGTVLCCEDRLDETVEHFSVGAMDVDSALSYFRRTPNKAVITGAHRSDIQLAAMETSTKCIILTGGYYTNDVIIGKARVKGIPIISVNDATFATVEKIEAVLGKVRIREQKKIDRVREIMRDFDLEQFLRRVGR
jgi:hypothetical protein